MKEEIKLGDNFIRDYLKMKVDLALIKEIGFKTKLGDNFMRDQWGIEPKENESVYMFLAPYSQGAVFICHDELKDSWYPLRKRKDYFEVRGGGKSLTGIKDIASHIATELYRSGYNRRDEDVQGAFSDLEKNKVKM